MKVLLSIILFFSLTACSGPPSIYVKLWAGDSSTASIRRSQDNEQIQCQQREFDNYMCITYEDYATVVNTYLDSCAEWKQSGKSREEMEELLLDSE